MIRAIVFDFDGVLVESTEVKTRAFARLFSGEGPVDRIVEYHVRNMGVSRFVKFESIYRDILKRALPETELRRLCREFSRLVTDEVVACPWVAGALEFLQKHRGNYRFFIVSATPERELREIVRRRGMRVFFQEVLGSPKTKETLLLDIMRRRGLSPEEIVFIGDAESDWTTAQRTGVGFVLRRSPGAVDVADFCGLSIASLAHLDTQLSVEEKGVGSPGSKDSRPPRALRKCSMKPHGCISNR